MDFGRKVGVIQSAEAHSARVPDDERKALLKDTFNKVWTINDKRKIVAHSNFAICQDGVVFRRVVAKTKLQVTDVEWRTGDFIKTFDEIDQVAKQLRRIVDTMVPYSPS